MSIENTQYIDSASMQDVEVSQSLRLAGATNTAVAYFDGQDLKSNDIIKMSGSYVRIGKRAFALSSTPEVLWVLGNEGESTVAEFKGNNDGFLDVKVENENTGSQASSDLACISDFGNNVYEGYIDMGINSSTFNMAEYSIMLPGDGYLFTVGSASLGGNLTIGTLTPNKYIKFHIGGGTQDDQIMQIGEGYISSSVPIGIGHPKENAWLTVEAATLGTSSIHINKAATDLNSNVAYPNTLYNGPDGGLRWRIGTSDEVGTSVLTYIPGTIFKQTQTTTISASTAATQSFLNGVPAFGVTFPPNWFSQNQNFRWDVRGSYTSAGNNRDYRLQFLLETADAGPVTRSIVVDSGVVRPSTLPVTDQGWWSHGLINVASTGSLLAFRGRSNWEFFTGTGTLIPFPIRVSSSFANNTKPLRLLAFINFNSAYGTGDTMTTEAALIEKV